MPTGVLVRVRISVLTLVTSLAASPLHAADAAPKPMERSLLTNEESAFPLDDPFRPRSDIGIPIVSFILPGFDQWWEGQTAAAIGYSGAALGGLIYSSRVYSANHLKERAEERKAEAEKNGEKDESEGLDQKGIAERKYTLGSLIYQGAGGLSAYHSFRTAVRSRQGRGQYEFLHNEESSLDLLSAPFRFEYLKRPTTFIPLAIIAAVSAAQLSTPVPEDRDFERDKFTSADGFFAGAFSYNAGTHEEALFRGWVMPVMREYWGSDFWANASQAVLFAAAHLNTNSTPVPQLLLGFHLGYVTQENGWMLGESVFIHAWWDVLAFATQYHYKQKAPGDKKQFINPVLWLPPLQFNF